MRITSNHDPASLASIDLFDPHHYVTGDPHGAWRSLRESSPVHWFQVDANRGFWAVTKYEHVCQVLRDFDTFTSEQGNILTMLGKRDAAGGKMLAVTDPPKHTEIKRQINGYFTSAATKQFEPVVRELARRVIAPATSGEGMDFAAATAFYPIAFTALVMGIATDDWARLKHFSYVAIADQDPEITGTEEEASTLAQAHSEIFYYFAEEVGRSNANRNDATGAIARARLADRPLNDEEKIYNLYSLLLGATVTTSHAMNAGILAFLENRDQYNISHELGCTEELVDEILRWSSPANHFLRHATRAIHIGGVLINEGDPVTAWLGSANRDEDVFVAPFHFDVRRQPNKHIAFGVGAHRCLGAPMARLALRVFLEEFLRHVESFELVGSVEHLASNFIAGIKQLPIRITLRPESRHLFTALPPLSSS